MVVTEILFILGATLMNHKNRKEPHPSGTDVKENPVTVQTKSPRTKPQIYQKATSTPSTDVKPYRAQLKTYSQKQFSSTLKNT